MSSATATGHCSLIAAYLGGPISEIPSSAVVVMKQEPGGGGGGQASFLLSSSSSKQQQPSPAAHIFPVDLNANDYAFSLEKTLSDSSKAETARPDTDSTSVEEEIGKIKEQQESKSPTLPPPSPSSSYSLRFLSEVNPGLEEHQEISPITWNPVNFGESELKVRGDAEDDKANVKRNSNANRYMNLRKKSKRLSEDRPRQKRQAARDMCRPLKQWLYCHRDTPYPTKAEKQDLALRSRMTLTQVSNWFANARRRLKNTVSGGPDVTWARRIKLYNRFVVGNQELLSVSSEDTMWDDEDITMDAEATTTRNEEAEEEEEGREGQGRRESGTFTRWKDRPCGSTRVPSGRYLDADPEEDPAGRRTSTTPTFGPGIPPPPPGKFKQGILQRYLTDACERVVQIKAKKRKNMAIDEDDEEEEEDSEEEEEEEEEEDEERRRQKSRRCHHRNRFRNASGSLSSHDYEEMSLSAPGTPTKEQHHSISNEIQDDAKDNEHRNSSNRDRDDLYWKEISAAMALTSLAMRSRLNSGSSRASSARI